MSKADDGLHVPERGAIPMHGGPALVSEIAVTVVMRITPLPEHRWLDERIETLAVLPAQADYVAPASACDDTAAGRAATDSARVVRFDGLVLELHPDECESYYFNLMVDKPQCFVAYKDKDDGASIPMVVTASYDLAASFEEGDHRVDAVPLDAGLYPQIEAFLLAHYSAEKKVKRKRRNWKKE